jgi:hypothetical protein
MMTKRSPELLTALADTVLGDPSLTHAAKANGVHPATLFRFIKESNENPDAYIIEFMGETVPFHRALQLANRAAIALVESELISRSVHGGREKIYFQGRPQWVEREDIPSDITDPEILQMLYGQPDRWLRKENPITGEMERVQLEMRRAPSDASVLAVLKAKSPKGGWTDTRNVNLQVGGGVMVIGKQSPTPLPEPIKMVEHVAAEIVQEAIEDETVHADQDDTPPQPSLADEEADDPVEMLGDAPEMQPEATPAQPAEPADGLTPLQRDLKARLAKGPANPRPKAPVHVFRGGDD